MVVRQIANGCDDSFVTAGNQKFSVLATQVNLFETGEIGGYGDGVEQGKYLGAGTHDEVDGLRDIGGVHFGDGDVHGNWLGWGVQSNTNVAPGMSEPADH